MTNKHILKKDILLSDKFREDIELISADELSDPKVFRNKTIHLLAKWFDNSDSLSANIFKKVNSIFTISIWMLFMQIIFTGLLGLYIIKSNFSF